MIPTTPVSRVNYSNMVHGSLFSGIGGFDLSAEWMGWENAFHCEFNPFCQRVLKYYWPNAKTYTDIRETDFTVWRGQIDVLTGGFPCQPYSTAGKRRGKDDDRHLWPEMLRAIREIRPRWIVGENVRGIISWSKGLVFEEVQAGLETEGYEVQPFVLPAASVNAPHLRNRIWFVAYSGNESRETETERGWEKHIREGGKLRGNSSSIERSRPFANSHHSGGSTPGRGTNAHRAAEGEERKREPQCRPSRHGGERIVAHATGQGLPVRFETGNIGVPGAPPKRKELERNASTRDWREFPTQPPVLPGDDGISAQVAGYTARQWYNEHIRAAGNAIVPQVALQIFKAIAAYENS